MVNDALYVSEAAPVVDINTGKITQSWFRFIRKLADKAQILNGNTTTSAVAGSASALPATPAGYLSITIDGAPYKVPYYK
jgi:hypothetical protein